MRIWNTSYTRVVLCMSGFRSSDIAKPMVTDYAHAAKATDTKDKPPESSGDKPPPTQPPSDAKTDGMQVLHSLIAGVGGTLTENWSGWGSLDILSDSKSGGGGGIPAWILIASLKCITKVDVLSVTRLAILRPSVDHQLLSGTSKTI